MSDNIYNYRSILLKQQESLFRILDTNIKLDISADGHTLVASNISEESIINLTMVTNNPINNACLHFDNIMVFLDKDLNPTPIFGFYDICSQTLEVEDLLSYINGKNTFQPFLQGFQNGTSINELCNQLSLLSKYSPDTTGRKKNYTCVFGNNTLNQKPNNYQTYNATFTESGSPVTETSQAPSQAPSSNVANTSAVPSSNVPNTSAVPSTNIIQTYELPSTPASAINTLNPGFMPNYSGILVPTPSLDTMLSGNCPYVEYPKYPPFTPEDLKVKINSKVDAVNVNIRQLNNTVYYIKSGKIASDLLTGDIPLLEPANAQFIPKEIMDQINGINSNVVAVNGTVKYIRSDNFLKDAMEGKIPFILGNPYYPPDTPEDIKFQINTKIDEVNVTIRQYNNSVNYLKSSQFGNDLGSGNLPLIKPAYPDILPLVILDGINGINSNIVGVNGVIKYVTSDNLIKDAMTGSIPLVPDFPYYPPRMDPRIVNGIKNSLRVANSLIKFCNDAVIFILGVIKDGSKTYDHAKFMLENLPSETLKYLEASAKNLPNLIFDGIVTGGVAIGTGVMTAYENKDEIISGIQGLPNTVQNTAVTIYDNRGKAIKGIKNIGSSAYNNRNKIIPGIKNIGGKARKEIAPVLNQTQNALIYVGGQLVNVSQPAIQPVVQTYNTVSNTVNNAVIQPAAQTYNTVSNTVNNTVSSVSNAVSSVSSSWW